MSRFIDAEKIKIIDTLIRIDESGNVLVSLRDIERGIAQTPTEYVQKVISCKDCEDYDEKYHVCKFLKINVDEWDFCSKVIKKGEE